MAPVRVRAVAGYEGRVNDVLFHPAALRSPAPSTVVFFPGDVQDYPEAMECHRDNRNYLKWNLDNMAVMLSRFFPYSHICVIRPSRIEFKSFSCYDNFVPSNNAGVPDHTPTHYALHHLERLLQAVTYKLKAIPSTEFIDTIKTPNRDDLDIDFMQESKHMSNEKELCEESTHTSDGGVIQSPHSHTDTTMHAVSESDPSDLLWWRTGLALARSPLHVLGFSKGCVVLNQLICEFHYVSTLTPHDQPLIRFMERIGSMYWLDGGHAGGKNTWITSRSLLETLTRLDVEMFVHVSPYQIRDERRPWIGREEKSFMRLLRKLGAKVRRYVHAECMPQSLHAHFHVLGAFKRVQDSAPPAPPSDSEDEDL